MQKKIIIIVVCLVIVLAGIIFFNVNIETEYTPEIEIDESNLRKTLVSLYFLNSQTNELEKETRLIDVKDLLKNPYEKVIDLLLEGPQRENLERVIPEGTKMSKVEYSDGILTIYLTRDFLKCFDNENRKNVAINSISNTLTEFKEINSVNVIVDGNDVI